MPLASTILHKRSSISSKVPSLSDLQIGELALNTADGKIFTKTEEAQVISFLNSSSAPYVLITQLSSVTPQYGNNVVSLTAERGAILGGSSNSLNHSDSFIIGSNIDTHNENFTYMNNLSVVDQSSVGGDLFVSGNVEIGDSQELASLYVTNEFVGINTETPNEALTVVGNISATGDLKLTSTSTTSPTNSSLPVAWLDVFVNSICYKLPLYQ